MTKIKTMNLVIKKKSPSDDVGRILQLAPDSVKVRDNDGQLKLHDAVLSKASSDIIIILYDAHPEAAEIQDY
jgi:hypothetical protein